MPWKKTINKWWTQTTQFNGKFKDILALIANGFLKTSYPVECA
jgi:hypothetical protein